MTQFIKKGGFEKVLEGFYKLNPSNVTDILKKGYKGLLSDGNFVNVRKVSTFKLPTLEVYNSKNKNSLKVRYNE
jgi:hypothetical protein